MFAFLIQTVNGYLLFDTGIDPDDHEFLDPIGEDIKIDGSNLLLNRLQEMGLSPADISYVIISHLHFDHAGLLRYFQKAKIFIQRQEYGYAINPPTFAAPVYRTRYYTFPQMQWHWLDGDELLFPGILAISTPGHTPGHQSLLVKMADGTAVILTGDCVYLPENIDQEIIPGLFVDPGQALHSVKKIKNYAHIAGAKMLFSHSL